MGGRRRACDWNMAAWAILMVILIRLGHITYHQIMRILPKALHLALRCRRSGLLRNLPSLLCIPDTGSTDLSLNQLESLHSLVGSLFTRYDICKLEWKVRVALLRDSLLR